MLRTTSRRADIRRSTMAGVLTALLLLTGAAGATRLAAQDANFARPIADLERRLQDEPFTIISWHGARAARVAGPTRT